MAQKVAREAFKFLIALVFIIVLLGILGEMMFHASWIFDGVYYLSTGWAFYPIETASDVKMNWSAVATAGVAVVLFGTGLHLFIKWLYHSRNQTSNKPAWRLRNSLNATLLIVFLFVAGLSTVGLVHQLTWLATTEEALLDRNSFNFSVPEPQTQP